jgi:hypothetical protein
MLAVSVCQRPQYRHPITLLFEFYDASRLRCPRVAGMGSLVFVVKGGFGNERFRVFLDGAPRPRRTKRKVL